ncbi:MAG: translocase [Bryobacteraceae bacterium]|nr:translocase [Bryobacteraceae bacterium]
MVDEPRSLRTHPELFSHVTFPLFKTEGEKPKSWIEKALSVFADVRAGEGAGALLMAVNAFILLSLYYLLKPARETLILTQGGAEVKAYSAAGQALLLILVIPFYGWIGTKVDRFKLVAGSLVFFALNLAVFYLAGQAGAREGVVFYIWLGIFNVFVVSQFWAFANDIYTEGQGRRLFPFIGIGSSLGGVWGALAASQMIKRMGLSPYDLMAVAGAMLILSLVIVWVVNRREKRSGSPEAAMLAEKKLNTEGGFQLIMRDRYLMLIAAMIVLLNFVNTSGEYILGKLIVTESFARFGEGAASEAARGQFIGGTWADFFMWVNLLGLVLQAGFVSRLIRHIGVRGSLFVMPCISLASYAMVFGAPMLAIVKLGKTLENSTDYSLQNTLKQALWLPTSREAKYKAKAAVDTFFMRAGDFASGGAVAVGTSIGASVRMFALFNVALAAVWLWVAWRIKAEHRRRTL